MLVEENRQWVMNCPRYLIGIATIFWGIMVEHELIGIGLAFFFEGYNWFKSRWQFEFEHYVKAWHMSVIIAVLIAFIYWIDGAQLKEMRVVFEWLPFIFAPLIFVQRYGEADVMPLNTFSVMARYRMKMDLREGRKVQPYMINFSTPFFVIIILTAGMRRRSGNFYDLFSFDVLDLYSYGVALMLALFVFSYGVRKKHSLLRYSIAYFVMVLLGVFFLGKLKILDAHLRGKQMVFDDVDMEQTETNIGKLGKIKQSKRIKWRMWVPESKALPKRVPFTVYNIYGNGLWTVSFRTVSRVNSVYKRAVSYDNDEGALEIFSVPAKDASWVRKKDGYRFLSSVQGNESDVVMPHLSGYFVYGGLVGEEAAIERSPLGSVRIGDPDATINCYLWTSTNPKYQFSKPIPLYDNRVDIRERPAVRKIVDELGLRDLSLEEKIAKLQHFFFSKFKYTQHLTIIDSPRSLEGKTALHRFLVDDRKGHCEYFATAATLLLREAGESARYVNGFAVRKSEKLGDAYLLRGDQAHAWSQVWNGESWIDVDLTPPDWENLDFADEVTLGDSFADWWKMWREDFQVWRNEPENATLVTRSIIGILAAMVIWVFLRLYFSKGRSRGGTGTSAHLPKWKIMRKFDRWCTKILGGRPQGMPYGSWVLQLRDKFPDKKEDIHGFVNAYQEARFAGESNELVDEVSHFAKLIMQRSTSAE